MRASNTRAAGARLAAVVVAALVATLTVTLLGTLLGTLVGACEDKAIEPGPIPVASSRGPAEVAPHNIHRIIEADHRHVIQLVVEDEIVLPSDPAFDWRVEFEHAGGFLPAPLEGGIAYRASKAGLFRMMVFGNPKCLTRDGGCGLSKRRWDVTAVVN